MMGRIVRLRVEAIPVCVRLEYERVPFDRVVVLLICVLVRFEEKLLLERGRD